MIRPIAVLFLLAALALLIAPLVHAAPEGDVELVAQDVVAAGALALAGGAMLAGLAARATGRTARLAAATLTLGSAAAALWCLGHAAPWLQPLAPGRRVLLAGSALLVAGFPLLLAERLLAVAAPLAKPSRHDGADAAARLSRLPLAVVLLLALGQLGGGVGIGPAVLLPRLAACLVLLVALELLLRAMLFLGRRSGISTPADSILAGLLRPERPRLRLLLEALRRQTGFDLDRSFAASFLRRALPGFVVLLLLCGWLLTGVTTLPLDRRAVSERLGRPVAVLGPGLHLLLPWPLGHLRPVEFGAVHAVRFGAAAEPDRVAVAADAPPPAGTDRLWDRPHPTDQGELVAASGEQGFAVVEIDLAILYRVGLHDRDAIEAAYGAADPDRLVQAVAGRVLAQEFAGRTLQTLLQGSRSTLIDLLRTSMQQQLDGLGSGLQVMAITIEAIHPPQDTAHAFHAVQAAEIAAVGEISRMRGLAIRTRETAAQTATTTTRAAAATAVETIDAARADAVLFEADRSAAARDRPSFLLERRLHRLAADLPRAHLVILDHRLGASLPILDGRGLDGRSSAETTPP